MKLYSLSLALLLTACGSSPPASKPPNTQSCEAIQADARSTLAKVVDENRACTKDEDCVTVGFGASCFDSCTRAVNLAGKGAVDRVSTLVEASECKPFLANTCKLEIPPCAPQPSSKCVSGKCE